MQSRLALNLTGDRLAALPLAIVYVTDRCNSRCVTCDYWQHGQTNLPVAQARRLAPELRALGTKVVLLSGGEPLVHPHWHEVAGTLREAGLRLWLLTAGLSLARHADQVCELCERVTVSLDGATPETYRAIRGVDGFDAVCKGIRAAVARGLPVTLRCTVQRGNFRELPGLVRLALALGVEQISFLAVDVSTHVAFARAEDYERTMALRPDDLPAFAAVLDELERDFAPELARGFIAERPAKLRRLHQYFAALLGQGSFPTVRCNAPRFSAVIGADGHLQPCYFIDGATRLNGQPLAQALNAPAMAALRHDIRAGRRPECKTCVCSMYRSPRQLVSGQW
jgi:MoaA/NifB/PqqE/SkfB family radical SAM enzyme